MVLHGAYPVDPRVAREARVALEHGFEVDVIAMRDRGQPRRETVDGSRVVRLPIAHRRGVGPIVILLEYAGFTLLASLRLAWLFLRRRYDVVQVHNPPDFLILAAVVPKLLGARIVLDVHDFSSDMFEMRLGQRRGAAAAQRILRAIERGAARLADAVLTVHEPYRRELVRRGVPARKVTVVMNSLDETLLPARRAVANGGPFRVVYHGTVAPHYGVELLVEAAAEAARQIADLRLEIYGSGDLLSTVRSRAEELGIGDRLTAPGVLPQREVLERIVGASAGVVPNRPMLLNRFALSSKLFEYVALGVPAVVADLPTLREHFSPGEVSFFRAGDPAALAEALVGMARDPGAADVQAKAALRRYDGYRWPLSAARYLEAVTGAGLAREPEV
jgi:glycosyltransferase involved in cell wall biosynthesis